MFTWLFLPSALLLIAYLVRSTNPVVSGIVAAVSACMSALGLCFICFGFLMFSAFVAGAGGRREFLYGVLMVLVPFVAVATAILVGSIRLIRMAIRRTKVTVTPLDPPAPPSPPSS